MQGRLGPDEGLPVVVPPPVLDRVVRVVPDLAAVAKAFDYTVPPALDTQVRVGTMVRIPLHGRRVAGWVVAEDVEPPSGVKLQPLAGVRGWGPPAEVISLARWAAWRWAGPLPALLGSASPPVAVRGLPRPADPGPSERRPTSPGQERPSPEPTAGPDVWGGGTVVLRLPPAEDPFAVVVSAADRLDGAPADAGVLVLAPSQRGAAELGARLRRTGRPVAVLPQDWPKARAGRCVVVGTRAAAFAPLPRLAAAVVLDAHDEVYNEERAPTWCAWMVVEERARRDGAPCVLVSPCPTLDVLAVGPLVTVSRQAERAGWPALEVVDRRGDDPRTGMFSDRLVALLRWGLADPNRRVLCVINRTGRVRLLACAACHELARCEHCAAAVELVDPAKDDPATDDPANGSGNGAGRLPFLRCRRCGRERPVVCAACGASRMKTLRAGVTRIREELEALIGASVAAVWGAPARPSAAQKSAGQKAADQKAAGTDGGPGPFEGDSGARVVVGTEAVLHRTGAADAVAFLDFDAELLAPRLRAAEEALALLARAGRLVGGAPGSGGGGRAGGRVLVQTRLPEHPALAAATLADPGRLAAAEGEIRHALELPPVTAMAVISGAAADVYGRALSAAAPAGIEVRGPVDGNWSVRAPDHEALGHLLASVARPPGRLRVAVDPVRA